VTWEIGLSTGIGYREPVESVLPALADAGFRTLELATARTHIDLKDPSRLQNLRRQIEELGIRVPTLHAPFGQGIDLTDGDPTVRESSLRHLTDAADVLAMLGGELYVIHPGGEDHNWVWEREQRLSLSVEGLNDLWAICRERGLTLVVETPLPHLLGGQPRDFDWILSKLPSEDVGVCIDTSHTALGGTLFESVERYAHRLVHLQVSDNRGTHDDHLPPGEGNIEWAVFLHALDRVGYDGLFLLEISGESTVQDTIPRIKTSIGELFPDSAT
jgi:sugar phosphate isomerase/epimerase